MSSSRTYKTEAIVLRGSGFGEADRVLTLYTREKGKLRAIAKGASRPGSKLAGYAQVLSHSFMTLARGRNLDIITQSQAVRSFPSLHSDLERLSRGLYIAELVDSFTAEGVENRGLFDLLCCCLERLDQGDGELLLHFFELKLLKFSGYFPELEACLRCRRALDKETGYFVASEGGVLCPECCPPEARGFPLSAPSRKAMVFLSRSFPQAISRLRLSPRQLHEIRSAIKEYIAFLLERQPRSRLWLEQVSGEKVFTFKPEPEYNQRC